MGIMNIADETVEQSKSIALISELNNKQEFFPFATISITRNCSHSICVYL